MIIRKEKKMSIEIAQFHVLNIVVCADKEHTEKEILAFAELNNPAGTRAGWTHDSTKEWDTMFGKMKSPTPCDQDSNKRHWILTV